MTAPNIVKPTGITLDKPQKQLVIKWSDGAECHYPLDNLREACPCVECRGGHENMGRATDPENILSLTPARSYQIDTVELVGNYALQPFWEDGHHTGIYTWEYLKRLCVPTSR
jgi:DUF971 family protein